MTDLLDRRCDAFCWWCLSLIVVIGLVTPSLVIFFLEITVGEIAPSASLADIAHRQFAEGHNLFLLAVIGLIPFGALAIVLRCLSCKLTRGRFCFFALCGLAGILALMIPAHLSVWRPLYTDEHASSTAVIAFLFIPFYCTVTMGIGLGVATIASIPTWIRKSKKRNGDSLTNN